jgi:pyruvate/2-oxoglutarate dehydrogenase complex dihydrolipoamide dehydrogenase (E3) component
MARCVAAAKEQPEDTVMLRSDLMSPAQRADAVLAAAGESPSTPRATAEWADLDHDQVNST